ncbi:MAG: NAD(P)-binding domain-containing protein [Proteobacteria bacterium]|nr:NAD(P)-binding domain-containing protein [Pseudomonadota bacterium]
MKSRLYILAPNGNDFAEQQMSVLSGAYDEVLHINKVMPFSDLPLIADNCEKVFAIDPDFCDWNIPNSALDTRGLLAVCLDTTSYSWIDLEYAKGKGISVTNVRGWSTESVAEQSILIAMNLARKLPLLLQNKMEINFETMRGAELRGKTAGIIGLGKIGTRIAELCAAFGMNVCYWSRKSQDDRFAKTELADVFKNADFIFPALSKNKDTEGIIKDLLLKSMKSGAIFTEISDNFLYNHNLLLDMVKNNKIYGYGFEELHPKSYEGNILAVPPVAYYTTEAMNRNTAQWLDCIVGVKNSAAINKLN